MNYLFWILCFSSIGAILYSEQIHLYFREHLTFYSLNSAALIQVIFSVLAGVFATKAADSSRELKELMKVREINELINQANKESERLHNLKRLVDHEVEQQFARDMLLNHRQQLIQHWEEIQRLETLLVKEDKQDNLDPRIRELIRGYILRSRYLDEIGDQFLRSLPIVGWILRPTLGPLWKEYYTRNIGKINRILLAGQNEQEKYVADIAEKEATSTDRKSE